MTALTLTASPIGAEIQRLVRTAYRTAYRTGVEAGHADALVHIEIEARDAWGDMQQARAWRDRSHREHSDYQVWAAVADRHAAHIMRLRSLRSIFRDEIMPILVGEAE